MKSIAYQVCLLLAVGLWWAQCEPLYAIGDARNSAESTGADVLTRGPVHEAFAQPTSTGRVDALVIPQKPPQAIEEIPPDAKPAGENVTWIPGYWAWDDDRKDFLWVSGVWRIPPPGQQWVAGYWTAVSDGYQWVPGFWNPVTAQEVEYFPEPPATLEQGPTSEAPSSDYVWMPGCWRWHQSRYVWQPGYWAVAEPDWVWVPASYYWCPRGWVFCDGYWDYPLTSRGLLFAPVWFGAAARLQPRLSFSPSVVVDAGILSFYLFARPSYSHYYFGDYYAASYDRLGIFPWFAVHSHRGYSYDPLFSYYQWQNRTSDPHWAGNLRDWHRYYREHAAQRPPHSLSAQQRLVATATDRPDRDQLMIADTLANVRQKPDASVKLAAVPVQERAKLKATARLIEEFKTQRAQLETKAAVPGAASPGNTSEMPSVAKIKAPQKLPLPKVPTIGSARESPPGIGFRPESPRATTPGATPGERRLPAKPERPTNVAPGLTPKSDIAPKPNAVPQESPRVIPRETPRVVPRQEPRFVPREAPQVREQKPAPAERGAGGGGKGQGKGHQRK